jgi:drug/metabolite transporter (DMT)-like permease
MTAPTSEHQLTHYLRMLLLAFIWGSSFILMKLALFDDAGKTLFTSTEVAAMRILFAGLTLLPFAKRALKTVRQKHLIWLLIVGVCGNLIPAFLFTRAQTQLDSSIAGMLNSLVPIFTLIIAIVFFKTKIKWMQIVGVFTGLCGAIGLISLRNTGGEMLLAPSLMIVAATICYAISVNVIRNKLHELRPLTIASVALAAMAIPCLVFLFTSDVMDVVHTNPTAPRGLISVLTLSIIGTAAALVMFNKLVQQTGAIFASSTTYIIPVFAAFWGWVDHETLTMNHLFFALIILTGVYLINRKR